MLANVGDRSSSGGSHCCIISSGSVSTGEGSSARRLPLVSETMMQTECAAATQDQSVVNARDTGEGPWQSCVCWSGWAGQALYRVGRLLTSVGAIRLRRSWRVAKRRIRKGKR